MNIIRPSNEQLRKFYGYTPRCEAWAAVDGERVVAVAGFNIRGGECWLFADLNAEMRRNPIKMVRCGREIVRTAAMTGLPVRVCARYDTPRSMEFLQHLGFEVLNG